MNWQNQNIPTPMEHNQNLPLYIQVIFISQIEFNWNNQNLLRMGHILSRPKTHSKGMTVISHFKPEGL